MISAESAARAIADGTLQRDAAIAPYLAAMDAGEPEIRAFAHLQRDRYLARHGQPGPLAGLPVAIKDIIDTADMPTACGSPIYRGRMPPSDAPVVTMIRGAGGVIVGKTVTTEFAAVQPGPTRNPRRLTHTPGGSSSGSAAAVAAGFVPFSVGTQTAGSVIRPASFCGVAGLKPTAGLLPGFGVKGCSWTLDTVGLFAATVRDLAFFASAVTGQSFDVPVPGSPPRFGYARMQVWDEIDPAMERAMAVACGRARDRGAEIETLAVDPVFEAAHRAQFIIQDYELARSLSYELDTAPDRVSPRLRTMLQAGLAIPAARYADAMACGRDARSKVAALFGGADVLIAPSACGAAPEGLDSTGSPNLTRLWTLLGLPCVNVPGLTDTTGLPLGIQVIGKLGQDRATLQAAAWLEDALADRMLGR